MIALCFLASCSTLPSNGSGLSVPEYTMAQRTAVHDELSTGCCKQTVEFLKDYRVLRAQARID